MVEKTESPRDFTGNVVAPITIAGREFQVGPLTMGMRRRISAEIAKVPPPSIPAVDVQGIVEAMYRARPDGDEAGAVEGAAGKKLAPSEMVHIRRDIANAVQEMVREARALREQWPPAVETTPAHDLIFNNEKVQEVFVWEMLRLHNPGLRREEVKSLLEDDPDNGKTGMSFAEFNELFLRAFLSNQKILDRAFAEREASQRAIVQESSGPKLS